MSLIKASSSHSAMDPTGEHSNKMLACVPTLALTHSSRFNFNNPYNDSRVTGVGDAVKYVLSDAIMQYAGYQGMFEAGISTSRQDNVLSNATLAAETAQIAYVSK
jgi:hypothetical protein